MQRIDVYRGDELAATFQPNAGPTYYGQPGGRVRELVNRYHVSYDPLTGRSHSGGLSYEDWPMLIATVCDGLAGKGFDVRVHGAPPVNEDEDWVLY